MNDVQHYIRDAWIDRGGNTYELVGRFRPIAIGPEQAEVSVPEPLLPPYSIEPSQEVVTQRVHAFEVIKLREAGGLFFFGLLVKVGDPVEWLRGWTWDDPHRRVARKASP